MNKKIAILLVLLTGFTPLFAQNREKRSVDTFTKIAFRIPGKVYVRQGNTQSVEIEASKELLKIIETEVDGSTLKIQSPDKWNWRNDERATIYITVKDLNGASVSGSGDLIGESRFVTRDIDLKVSGSGSLKLEIESSGDVETHVSGSGDLHLKGKGRNIESKVSGSGKVILDMALSGGADFSISGSGRIEAAGRVKEVRTSISGSGKVLGADFEAERCDIRISGSGDVEIHVKDQLDANISGSGTVAYRGNPSKVHSSASGSGKVRKM